MDMRERMARFETWRRWRATFGGYFWLPCPLCGTHFGGHEWKDYDGKCSLIPHPDHPIGFGHGRGICPACTTEGRGVEVVPFMLEPNPDGASG